MTAYVQAIPALQRMLLVLLLCSSAAIAGDIVPDERHDTLTCPAPFELQVVRDLDFGRVSMAARQPGQVDVEPQGGYRQLGGAYASTAPAPAELVFCGPPGARFELLLEESSDASLDAQPGNAHVASGSMRVVALGAELNRRNSAAWDGVIGASGRVSLRVGGRLDIPATATPSRSAQRVRVSLRSL